MFSCSECSFKSPRRLNVHQREHGEKKSEETIYQCNCCSYTTNLPYNLRRQKIQENHGPALKQQKIVHQELGHQAVEDQTIGAVEVEDQTELTPSDPVTPAKQHSNYEIVDFEDEEALTPKKMYAVCHSEMKWKTFNFQLKVFNTRLAKLTNGQLNDDDVLLFTLHQVVEDRGGFHRIKNWDTVAAILGSTPQTVKDLYQSRLLQLEMTEKSRKSELRALDIPFWWDDGDPVSFTNRHTFLNPNVVSNRTVENVLRKIFNDYYLPSQVTDAPFEVKDTWMYVTKMCGGLILINMEKMYIEGAESDI
ncbi:uncharacterized protein LOC111519269 isoform X2 [Drosophila willistoni]|uniref:uncharacterized protein LOC111519269 isoform X2 n=1 Tax=Drosophila willistoni TaxID=7260 RepID=UPI001F07D723|nr:uncharacterized protein LOC111519269 isoform X2 [Drosophila willistoni]